MLEKVQIIFLIGLLGLLSIVLELVRRKKLQEKYSLLWLLTIVVLLVLSLWKDSLRLIAKVLGIEIPSNALFVVGLVFILAILLHFSVVISSSSRKHKELAQQFAILNWRVRQLEQKIQENKGAKGQKGKEAREQGG